MNPIPERVPSSQEFRPQDVQDTDEKHKVLSIKPFIQKETVFSASPEAKKRKISSLASEQCVFCLQKAPLEKTGRKYFVDNLALILSHDQILHQCDFFKTPIHLNDGSIYEDIKTLVFSDTVDTKDIEVTLRSLRNTELAFVVYYRYFGDQFHLTLSLFSNKFKEHVREMANCSFMRGLEFFSVCFYLDFGLNGDLINVFPERGVNERFRRKGICSSISLVALTKIYEHLGSEKTVIYSGASIHIGTVKFNYPLNCFFRKNTSESLRYFDPRSSSLTFDDIEKREESLDVFKFDPETSLAKCPDQEINLEQGADSPYLSRSDFNGLAPNFSFQIRGISSLIFRAG